MSWTESFTDVAPGVIPELRPDNEHTTQGAADQFDAARTAASAVIATGVVGDPATHLFNVTLSGHANPGHQGNDTVTASVAQAGPLNAEDADEAKVAAHPSAESVEAEKPTSRRRARS